MAMFEAGSPIRKCCGIGCQKGLEIRLPCLVGGLNPSEKYESQMGLLFPIEK